MTAWLVAQAVYAAVAWYFAARVVARSHAFGGLIGRELAATVRELRASGRATDVAKLGSALEPSPVASLLELDADAVSPVDLVSTAEQVSREAAPPVRLLRSLATVGTMLGLLAAVATLRAGLENGTTGRMEFAAAHALDSAVAGFVTALPCWTAVSLCRRRARETYSDLERLVLAMRASLERSSDTPSGTPTR